jgi:hypothetical protein
LHKLQELQKPRSAGRCYHPGMAKKPELRTRRWHIIPARKEGVPLGTVEAPNAKAAIEAAATEFDCPAWRLSAEPVE